MSLMGSYRLSGVLATTPVSSSTGIVNFTGFRPSGISYGNILGVALYCWSGAYTRPGNNWVPVTVKMLEM